MSQEEYIIAGSRTAIGKAKRGGFRFMTPVDLAYYAIKDLLIEILFFIANQPLFKEKN